MAGGGRNAAVRHKVNCAMDTREWNRTGTWVPGTEWFSVRPEET